MLLYFLDGLVYIAFASWMSVGFHGFVLVCLFNGCKAASALNKTIASVAVEPFYPAQIEPVE